jgi:hypothetical protein
MMMRPLAVFQRRLRGHQGSADVEVHHLIHLFQCGLLKRFRNGRAGMVHQYVHRAEGADCLLDAFFTAAASVASV